MNPDSLGVMIAERRYALIDASGGSREVVVRLGAPQQSDHGDFSCAYEIVGFGRARMSSAFGIDAFQAIQLALRNIGAELHLHRQRSGCGFFFQEEGDDLGFAAEAWTEGLGHQIVKAFGPLYGMRLSIARNAADMKNFQFGVITTHPSGKGTIGQYALHIQCPWRIVTAQCALRIPEADLMITGSGDFFEPAEEGVEVSNENRVTTSLQEKLLSTLFEQFDTETRSRVNVSDRLVVEQVEADDYGGFNMHLSGGFRLQVFPSAKHHEHWRLFAPGTEESHFVMGGEKLKK
jgi:hypothetical protein